ncbi:CaiB/BaiF CoA transferase family protein [Pseudogemmobacter sonorensis]|uniref:CaiB/BaiF CoA transferase family protein n=1 Tax=Pseudogemmobacter sonorensis TaxID=2989681 RepID=UPI003678C904
MQQNLSTSSSQPLSGKPVHLPLTGIKVVEFCHIAMGPTVGLLLAELGADVIKVEPLPTGDRTRYLKGHIAGSFGYFNRFKKSIGVDIKTEKGKEIVRRLVSKADVVTENFRAGTADRIGIGYETLSVYNDRLIYCSLKGFLPGPYENRAGLDELAQFMSGLAYMTGPLGQPLRAGTSIIDIGGGMFGTIGILAAILQRQVTGKGQKVESALYETAAFFMGQHMAGEAHTGKKALPYPVRERSWAIYETFETADERSVFIGLTSDKQWHAFCTAFGREDLLEVPEYKTNELRRDNKQSLRPIVASIAAGLSAHDLIEALAPLGCPVGLAAVPGDLFDDPQLNFEGRMSEATLPGGKKAKLPRLPLKMSAIASGDRPESHVPEFAENTDEVMKELGFSQEDVAAMREEAVIQ